VETSALPSRAAGDRARRRVLKKTTTDAKRADRYERIGDNAEKMMFAARPAFRMRCQILVEEGQIVQQRKESGCDCDQQHRFDEGGPAAPIRSRPH
jgi:hypothetical protein